MWTLWWKRRLPPLLAHEVCRSRIGLLPDLGIVTIEESDEPGLCDCLLVGVPVRLSSWMAS
jgi:hypothetical protein